MEINSKYCCPVFSCYDATIVLTGNNISILLEMKKITQNASDWQVMRERFQITDSTPPPSPKKEAVIADILPAILGTTLPDSEIPPATLLKHWTLVVGGPIAKHTKPTHVKNHILYVYSDHPGWLTELRRHSKEHYLKKINSILDDGKIRDIRFLLDPNIQAKKQPFPSKNR